MEVYYYWLIATAFLVMIELITVGFGVICFAVGTLAAAVTAYFVSGLEYQLTAFIVGSVFALVVIRPFALKWINKRKEDQVQTNTDAIIGRKVMVSEVIDNARGTGYVKIDGDVWRAKSEDGSVIEQGCEVTVISRDSIILTVK